MSGSFDAWYLIVSGRFWLRVARDGGDWSLWLVSFDGRREARREPIARSAAVIGERRWTSPWWDLELEPLAAPFHHVHPLVRPFARTRVDVSAPALRVAGTIDGRPVEGAGCQAHVHGTRRPDRFLWLHATLPGGRFVEAAAAKVPGLPEVALWANERERRNGPLDLLRNRNEREGTRWRVGPYELEADRDDFVGVTYVDPDGRPLYCYHAERARLRGPDVETDTASFEIAQRARLEGWQLSL